MLTGQQLVDRVRKTLLDSRAVTWGDDELLDYLNAGIAQLCGTFLDLYVVAALTALIAGPRQNLPPGGVALIDIIRNSDGTALSQQSLVELGRVSPGWAAQTQTADPDFFVYDKRSPRTFLVSPPVIVGTQVELVYSAIPDAIAAGDLIPVPDSFGTALWAYMLSMAYSKNSKKTDLAKATGYMGLYVQIIGSWEAAKGGTVAPPDTTGATR